MIRVKPRFMAWSRTTGYSDANPIFPAPVPGTFGNLEYRAVEGPGYWALDTAFSRLITLGGTRSIELRLESFNLTNHFNWGNPATNLSQSQFGRITTNGGAQRIMQFGVKYGF